MKPKFRSILSGITGISLVLLLGVLPAYAQRPEIKSFDPKEASYGHSVTIKGNNFGIDKTKLIVRFGAAQALITSASNQQLQVTVPAGATHDNLSVTYLPSGLTGYSREQFFVNFHGDGSGFALTNLQGQTDFPATVPSSAEGLFDLCMCDFDGDGLNDIAAAKTAVQSIEYYMNTSTAPGNINFAKNSSGTSYTLRYVQCGDLNGDGKPELIATDALSAGRVLIFKNNSTPGAVSFASVPVINLSPHVPKRIEIADLDLDGKPELIFTDEAAPPIVIVLKNESTTSAIAFSTTPLIIPLPYDPTKAIPSSNALAAQDIDGDDLPEIIVSPFLSSDNSIIYLIKNKSTAGTLSLTDITPVNTNAILNNLRVGDVDNDGKPDIAYTTSSPSKIVAVVLNQSTSTLAFSAPATISGGTNSPFGLDLGDMDGDGKLDVVAASNLNASVQVLRNQSSAGNVSFVEIVKTPTNSNNRHVVVGDVDNDGKPDIAFTSIDNTGLGIKASKIAILRNSLCMKPEVEPAGPLNVCTGNTDVVLTATLGGGVTYEWTNTTTGTTTTTPGNAYTPTVDGNYFVTAKSVDCTPDPTSNTVVFTTSASAPYAAPAPNVPPACIGSPLQFTTTNQGAGYGYAWTGPAGFTSSVREPLIPSATADNAGDYTVEIKAPSGCVLGKATVTAVVRFPPSFVITNTPASNVGCGATVPASPLTVSPQDSEYTYNWYLNGVLKATNAPTLTMSNPGEYYYIAKSINSCADVESTHYTYTLLDPPVALFNMQGSACQGEEVQMDNQSTPTNGPAPLFYTWLITNDGRTSDQESPVFTFPNVATYNVKLTVSYANGTCATDHSQSIAIVGTGLPPLVITNADNKYEICQDGELELKATTGFSSYEWSVAGETAESITVSAAGEYSVKAEAPSGCIVTAKRTITEIQGPIVDANATPPVIDEGEQTQLDVKGLVDYSWEPAETLSDPTIAQPTATPLASTSYTVSGKDATGCLRHATVLVTVEGASITNKLIPANFFSPNGDDQNQYWMVGLIDQYPQCNVTIYDDKGVKVFNSKPYQNNWDGTFNGKALPPGVYYFIIRCDGEESKARTGSITMMR